MPTKSTTKLIELSRVMLSASLVSMIAGGCAGGGQTGAATTGDDDAAPELAADPEPEGEEQIDSCLTDQPCENNGICHRFPEDRSLPEAGYECECVGNYSGEFCELAPQAKTR